MESKSKYDFDEVLDLCKLRVSEDKDAIMNGVFDLLEWVDSLKTIDTDGVTPLIIPFQILLSPKEDIPSPPLPHSEVLDNAANKNSNYIIIPKLK